MNNKMMKYIAVLIIIVGLQFNASSQYHFVNIVLSSSSEHVHPGNQPLYLSGNDILMGNWSLKSALLKQSSDSTRVASLMLQKGQELEFCFTNGQNYIKGTDSLSKCPIKYVIQGDTTLVYHYPILDFSNSDFDPRKQ